MDGGEASRGLGPEVGMRLRDPGAERCPDFPWPQGIERGEPVGEVPLALSERDAAHVRRAEPVRELRCRLLKNLWPIGERERVFEPEHAADRRGGVVEEDPADPAQHRTVAREPAHGIEARRQRHDAVERNPAVRRAHAEQAAPAGGDSYRARGVAAEREVHEAARGRRGGAARRAAGDAVRRLGIARRAVVHVLAERAEGELVRDRDAGKTRAGIEAGLHRGCRARGRLVAREPVRAAAAGDDAGDVEHVLDREGEAAEGALSARRDVDPKAQRAQFVGSLHAHQPSSRITRRTG